MATEALQTPPATTPPAVPPEHGSVGLLGRAVAVLLACASVTLGAPTWLRTALLLVASVAVVEAVVRRRRRGPADAVVVGTGGLLVVLALGGLVLNYLPGGISTTSWTLGFAVVALGALACCVGRGPRPRGRALSGGAVTGRAPSRTNVVTAGLAVGVLAASVLVSVYSYDAGRTAPLQLSARGPVTDGSLDVVASSAQDAGPLRLVSVSTAGVSVLGPDVELAAGQSVERTVAVPAGSRLQIQLRRPGSVTPLRELIVDGGALLPPGGGS